MLEEGAVCFQDAGKKTRQLSFRCQGRSSLPPLPTSLLCFCIRQRRSVTGPSLHGLDMLCLFSCCYDGKIPMCFTLLKHLPYVWTSNTELPIKTLKRAMKVLLKGKMPGSPVLISVFRNRLCGRFLHAASCPLISKYVLWYIVCCTHAFTWQITKCIKSMWDL